MSLSHQSGCTGPSRWRIPTQGRSSGFMPDTSLQTHVSDLCSSLRMSCQVLKVLALECHSCVITDVATHHPFSNSTNQTLLSKVWLNEAIELHSSITNVCNQRTWWINTSSGKTLHGGCRINAQNAELALHNNTGGANSCKDLNWIMHSRYNAQGFWVPLSERELHKKQVFSEVTQRN